MYHHACSVVYQSYIQYKPSIIQYCYVHHYLEIATVSARAWSECFGKPNRPIISILAERGYILCADLNRGKRNDNACLFFFCCNQQQSSCRVRNSDRAIRHMLNVSGYIKARRTSLVWETCANPLLFCWHTCSVQTWILVAKRISSFHLNRHASFTKEG